MNETDDKQELERLRAKLHAFFYRKGMNVSGFCADAGITQQYLIAVLRGRRRLTASYYETLLPHLVRYGWKDTDVVF